MRPGSGLHSVPPSLKPHFQQLRLVLEAVEKLGYPNLQVVFFLGFFPYGPSPLNTAVTSNLFIPLSGLVRTPKLGPPPRGSDHGGWGEQPIPSHLPTASPPHANLPPTPRTAHLPLLHPCPQDHCGKTPGPAHRSGRPAPSEPRPRPCQDPRAQAPPPHALSGAASVPSGGWDVPIGPAASGRTASKAGSELP